MADEEIQIPQARDGTRFLPNLCKNKGVYRVGEKTNQKEFRNFWDALGYLHKMEKAKWRRPNSEGNWGIVTGVEWISMSRGEIDSMMK